MTLSACLEILRARAASSSSSSSDPEDASLSSSFTVYEISEGRLACLVMISPPFSVTETISATIKAYVSRFLTWWYMRKFSDLNVSKRQLQTMPKCGPIQFKTILTALLALQAALAVLPSSILLSPMERLNTMPSRMATVLLALRRRLGSRKSTPMLKPMFLGRHLMRSSLSSLRNCSTAAP